MAGWAAFDEDHVPLAPEPLMSSPAAPGPVSPAQPAWVTVAVSIVVACSLCALLLSSLI